MRRPAPIVAILALSLALGCPSPDEPSREEAVSSEEIRAAVQHKNRALAFLEQDKPARAVEELALVVDLVPDDPLGYVNMAIARLRLQQPEEAARWARRAVEIAPEEAAGWEVLALVHEWKGEEAQADLARLEALERDPDDLHVRWARVRYLLQSELAQVRDEAVRELHEILDRAPGNVVALSELALVHLDGDELERAVPVLEALAREAGEGGETAEVIGDAVAAARAGERRRTLRLARVGTNLLKGREIWRLSSAQVRSAVQGFPLEEFRVAALRARRSEVPPETQVQFVDAGPLPKGFDPRNALTADGSVDVPMAADIDGDGEVEVVEGGDEIRLPDGTVLPGASSVWRSEGAQVGASISSLHAADLDHDGDLDLLATVASRGSGHVPGPFLWCNDGDGSWTEVTGIWGLAGRDGRAGTGDAFFGDLDRDADLDIVLAGEGLILWNERLGRFRSEELLPAGRDSLQIRAVGDLDADGCLDLVSTIADRLHWLEGSCGQTFSTPRDLASSVGRRSRLSLLDHDNDGWLDLLVDAGHGRVMLLRNLGPGGFEDVTEILPADGSKEGTRRLLPADVDTDGDLDLVLWHEEKGATGWWRNEGGNALPWIDVTLEPAAEASAKNPPAGIGARLEVHTGRHVQAATVRDEVTHFGLGRGERPDLLRIVWPNGVPQSRLDPPAKALVTEKEVLKGSCPFLYAWDGERFAFVTDLLWAAPLGLPLPVGSDPPRKKDPSNLLLGSDPRSKGWPPTAGWDPDERVRVALRHTGGRAVPREGFYELRITEELWETAYFDRVALLVVDLPAATGVYSNLKIQPPPYPDDELRFTEHPRPAAVARDGTGRDVAPLLAAEDARFLLGGAATSIQGIRTPWELVLTPPEGRPGVLLLTGWIYPTDASLNVALSQRRDLAARPPVLEVEMAPGRWRALEGLSPYPPGKTKTVHLELPPEARGRKLRIRSNLDIRWDAVAFAEPVPSPEARRTLLAPVRAEVRRRGFSAPWRESPEGPHLFDYERVSAGPRWMPVEGPFTRVGDVRELVLRTDDRLVVLGPGDELALSFDARGLPPVPEGARRELFLESFGWDKDADLNTTTGDRAEPYPCRAMEAYPPRPGECPIGEERLDWLERYQSRPALRE